MAPNDYCIAKHAAESTDLQRPNILIMQLLNFWAEISIFPYSPVRSSVRYMCLRMENTDVIHKNHSTEKKEKENIRKSTSKCEDHIYKSKESNKRNIIVFPSYFPLAKNDPDIWNVKFRNHAP